jgi:hypothetical protein
MTALCISPDLTATRFIGWIRDRFSPDARKGSERVDPGMRAAQDVLHTYSAYREGIGDQ